MSADQQVFPAFLPAKLEEMNGVDPLSHSDMETSVRMFVNQRIATAVEDILTLFGKTLARYREQIVCQQQELDVLRSAERSQAESGSNTDDDLQDSSWIKICESEPAGHQGSGVGEHLDETDVGTSAGLVKTEGGDEHCGGPTPPDPFDSAADPAVGGDGHLFSQDFDLEDSEEYCEDSPALWRPEETMEREGQSSGKEVLSPVALLQKHKQLPPVLSCRVCSKSFERMSYLLTHSSSHLRDCGVCGKHLERSESLTFHLKVHRETSLSCSICGQSFTLQGNLRMHMRIHSGERPYKCNVCSKSFGRKATLVRHMRCHTGEKPFTCTYCGHSFTEKGNLTVHLRTHTGERPYWCSTCNLRFSQLSGFYKHPCQRKGLISHLISSS